MFVENKWNKWAEKARLCEGGTWKGHNIGIKGGGNGVRASSGSC